MPHTNLQQQLQTVLNEKYSELAVKKLEVAGSGVQNVVFRGDSAKGPLAFRVPWERQVNNINDDSFSSRISLQKEAKLAQFCSANNIPVPKVHTLYLSDELDFLISDFVPSNDVTISAHAIGELTSRLHHISTKELHDERPTSKLLAKRIVERTTAFNSITHSQIQLPTAQEIECILKEGDSLKSLLHMDIRPVNLIGYNGEIQAIVDWDNSLIGHPLLELMRIKEVNEIDWDELKEGYTHKQIFSALPSIITLFYQLDTAVMLANLFIHRLHIEDKGAHYKQRVETISKKIYMSL